MSRFELNFCLFFLLVGVIKVYKLELYYIFTIEMDEGAVSLKVNINSTYLS